PIEILSFDRICDTLSISETERVFNYYYRKLADSSHRLQRREASRLKRIKEMTEDISKETGNET
ncbi:MAG: hypothetical protein J6N19_18290, partial [Clostridium sp.]|nr:hypothetical protein [Clostridium sp.]